MSYDFYFGTAPYDARQINNEPGRSEANGLYFTGKDFISQGITGTVMTFNDYFTVELWVRFIETLPSQNYYLFQKVNFETEAYPFFQFYFAPNGSFIIEVNSTAAVIIPDAYDSVNFPSQWVYVGVNFAKLYWFKDYMRNIQTFYSKTCAYIWGPNEFERSGCAVIDDYWDETWYAPYYWDTRMGDGLIGFIKTVYIWDFYKAMTNLHYTPRRNYPYKNQCSPFNNQGYPTCGGCDQYLGSSTCFSSCQTNSYATDWNNCLVDNCTNTLCTSCYSDTSAWNNNYCTSCISNAFLTSGTIGDCQCNLGYYYDNSTATC